MTGNTRIGGALLVVLPVMATPATAQIDGVDLRGAGQVGDTAAAVTVVEFGDFGCSACALFARDSWTMVQKEFIERGRVRWIFVPLDIGISRNSGEAALAALCAQEQDRFWPMHDRLFAERGRWANVKDADQVLRAFAAGLGLDSAAFDACMGGEKAKDRLKKMNEVGRKLRIRATPTFLLNEVRVRGAPPTGEFREILEKVTREATGSR